MATRTWNPFAELEALRREVERAFEDFGAWERPFSPYSFLPGMSARSYPLLNLGEDKDNLYVEALMPGVDPESLEISVQNETLRIAGEKSPLSQDLKPEAFHRNERSAGRFIRTLNLATPIETEKIKANYRNGLLLITMPKAEAAKPKEISVSVE